MKIVAIDYSNVFWSVALGGAPILEVKEIVLRQIREVADGYDRAAVCADGGKPFRAVLWPDYKAKRRERPQDLWSLLEDTLGGVDAAGFHVLRAPACEDDPTVYFEADDVIATVTAWATSNGHTCDIFSGDSDLAQLVGPGVQMLRRKAKGGIEALGAEGVTAWLKVPPALVVDVKALAGDTGDGYGNVFPGVGEQKALELLKWGGIDADDPPGAAAVRAVMKCRGQTAGIAAKINAVNDPVDRVNIGVRLALTRRDVPLDLSVLDHTKEPKADGAWIDRIIPDAEFEPVGQPATHGAPVQPPPRAESSALLRVDSTARMLAPAEEARNRLLEFKAFVKSVMVPNVDYGFIPGTQSKTPGLWKPGAEKMAEIYGLAPSFEYLTVIETWEREEPLFFYRVKCALTRKADGMRVAEKVGSCNSRETKYSGRWAFERDVPPHLDPARLKTREFTIKKGQMAGERAKQWRIPNEEIYDLVHTIESMAQKRAFVGAVILATRSGSIFTDLDGVPPEAAGHSYETAQWDR